MCITSAVYFLSSLVTCVQYRLVVTHFVYFNIIALLVCMYVNDDDENVAVTFMLQHKE